MCPPYFTPLMRLPPPAMTYGWLCTLCKYKLAWIPSEATSISSSAPGCFTVSSSAWFKSEKDYFILVTAPVPGIAWVTFPWVTRADWMPLGTPADRMCMPVMRPTLYYGFWLPFLWVLLIVGPALAVPWFMKFGAATIIWGATFKAPSCYSSSRRWWCFWYEASFTPPMLKLSAFIADCCFLPGIRPPPAPAVLSNDEEMCLPLIFMTELVVALWTSFWWEFWPSWDTGIWLLFKATDLVSY